MRLTWAQFASMLVVAHASSDWAASLILGAHGEWMRRRAVYGSTWRRGLSSPEFKELLS